MDKDKLSYAEQLAEMVENADSPEEVMRNRIGTEAGYIVRDFKMSAEIAASNGKRKLKDERESFIYTLKKAGKYSGLMRKSVICEELAEAATELLLDEGFVNVKVTCKCKYTVDNQFFYKAVVSASW